MTGRPLRYRSAWPNAAVGVLWAAGAGAATLSPSLSNCHPDCDMGELIAPLDSSPLEATPLETPTSPEALSPAGTSLLDYLNELLGPPVDVGDLPQAEPPTPELDIPPVEGTIR